MKQFFYRVVWETPIKTKVASMEATHVAYDLDDTILYV